MRLVSPNGNTIFVKNSCKVVACSYKEYYVVQLGEEWNIDGQLVHCSFFIKAQLMGANDEHNIKLIETSWSQFPKN